MREEGFPSCCGAVIFHSLSFANKQEIRASITRARNDNKTMIFAITNTFTTRQIRAAEILQSLGFRKIKTVVSRSTGHTLNTWMLDLTAKPKPKPKTAARKAKPKARKLVKPVISRFARYGPVEFDKDFGW